MAKKPRVFDRPEVRTAFLRVAATAGTSAHTTSGEDDNRYMHLCNGVDGKRV